MKQSELITLISKDTGVKYESVRKVLRKLTKYFCVSLESGESLRIGLGTFALKERGPKPVQNFKTGERYIAPPSHKLIYKPSSYVIATVKKQDINLLESMEEDAKQN